MVNVRGKVQRLTARSLVRLYQSVSTHRVLVRIHFGKGRRAGQLPRMPEGVSGDEILGAQMILQL
jgi:hypothetical protein